MEEVTHKQIYDRLIEVEGKVDSIDKNTKGLVEAFDALQGAFKVLGWVASAAKHLGMFQRKRDFLGLLLGQPNLYK